MITTPNFYKNEIYLPNAKESVTGDVMSIQSELLDFISEYEEECLITCLGYQLANNFMSNLDSSEDNGLIPTADVKWDRLLNGYEYVNPKGETVKWKGVVFSTFSGGVNDKSFLAYYVYYFYESNAYITRSDLGHQIEVSKNAETVTPTQKVTKAFRKFIDMVQGGYYTYPEPKFWRDLGNNLVGIDYYTQRKKNRGISLYTFISNMNELNGDDYYNDFLPFEHIMKESNEFGI